MPWAVGDVDRHFGGLSDKEKRMWCHVANGALEAGDDDGKACHKANGVVKKNRIKESISALLVMKANQMIEAAKMQMIASVFEGVLDNEPEGILRQSGWKKSGSHGDTVHYSHPDKAGHEIHLSNNGNWRHYDGDSALQSGFTGEKLRKHLGEGALCEADPRPRVEKDHEGKPVIPSREQYAQYFQDMQAKYIQTALENARKLWKDASGPEKKALDLEIEVGEDALKSKSVSEEEWPVEDDPAYNLKRVYPGHSPKDKVSYQSGGDWKGK